MVIECQEVFFRELLVPCVALVAGLPDALILQTNEDCLKEDPSATCPSRGKFTYLRVFEVRMLNDLTRECELRGHEHFDIQCSPTEQHTVWCIMSPGSGWAERRQ